MSSQKFVHVNRMEIQKVQPNQDFASLSISVHSVHEMSLINLLPGSNNQYNNSASAWKEGKVASFLKKLEKELQ